ncbi:MAG: hypothetical protein WC372_12405 [Candidatus Neomarinimicrobiota bacterium]|jgi:NAD-dependent SIR2 family protein deacetylase
MKLYCPRHGVTEFDDPVVHAQGGVSHVNCIQCREDWVKLHSAGSKEEYLRYGYEFQLTKSPMNRKLQEHLPDVRPQAGGVKE